MISSENTPSWQHRCAPPRLQVAARVARRSGGRAARSVRHRPAHRRRGADRARDRRGRRLGPPRSAHPRQPHRGSLAVCGLYPTTRNAASPAVDLRLFSNHTYRLAKLAAFVFAIAFTAMFFNFVFFLTQRWGYTLFQAGLAITPGPLVVIPVAVVAGRIADRRGHRGVLVAGGLVFAFAERSGTRRSSRHPTSSVRGSRGPW